MKTFYSVKYNTWFDNLEKARAFSKLNYTDNMIVHNCTSKRRIAAYNERVERSNYILKGVI